MAFQQEVKANCAIDSPVKTSSMMTFFSMPLLHLHDYLDVVQQILSGITEAHGDYRNLKQSERMLEETNEKMATVDANLQRLERLRQLQSKFEKKKFRGGTVNLIEDGRVLLHHGTLQKQSKRNVHHQYHFHLFNDSLCYSKVNASGKFVLHREMPLATCCVDALEKDIDAIRQHKFKLASAEKTFQIIAPNAPARQVWLAKIQEAINDCAGNQTNTLDRTVAAEWETDSNVTNCPFCDKKFNLVDRRHHCRKCGRVVCSACSPHRVILSNIDASQKSRICNSCFKEMEDDSVNMFKLNLVVQKATFLAPRAPGGTNDRNPYCVARLRQIRFYKQKLPVIKNSNNPVWGHKGHAVFFVDNISAAVLFLEIWDQRPLRKPVFLGQCETNMTDIPVNLNEVGPNSRLSHDFKMELKPRNAKDKFCTGKLSFSLELTIPMAMLDGQTDYFALMRRHMNKLAHPPTPIALAAVMVLHHEAKRRLEPKLASEKVEDSEGTPLIVIKDHKPAKGELRLHEGELLHGINQPSDDVWLGEDMDGKRGTFPSDCVKPTTEGLTMKSKVQNCSLQLEGMRKHILKEASEAVTELPYEIIVNKVLGSANFSKLSDRKKVIYEMLKSERVYVERLRRFNRLYAEPLKNAANRGMLKVLWGLDGGN